MLLFKYPQFLRAFFHHNEMNRVVGVVESKCQMLLGLFRKCTVAINGGSEGRSNDDKRKKENAYLHDLKRVDDFVMLILAGDSYGK